MSDAFIPLQPAAEYFLDEDDPEVVNAFKLVADLIDDSGDAEAFTLWLSTCRNAYTTVNAMFFNIRSIIGHGRRHSDLSRALHLLTKDGTCSREILDVLNLLLDNYFKKKTCWERSKEFEQKLNHLLTSRNHLDRVHINRYVVSPKGPARLNGSYYPPEYVAISSSEPSHLSAYFSVLNEVAMACRDIVSIIGILIDWSDSIIISERDHPQPELIPVESQFNPRNAHNELIGLVRDRIEAKLSIRESTEILELKSESGIWTPQYQATEISEMRGTIREIAKALSRDVEQIYGRLQETFKPNLGDPPLPSIFDVDLRAPDDASGRGDQDSRVVATVKDFGRPRPSIVRVAIADIPIEQTHYDPSRFAYKSDSVRAEIIQIAINAIRTSAQNGADVVIFPELFLPTNGLSEIYNTARREKIAIITGVEGEWDNNFYSNFVEVILHEGTDRFRQYKARPCNDEPMNLLAKGGQHVFRNSSIGSFAVIVCSDYRQFDVIQSIESCGTFVDFIVVCSMHPYLHQFASMAICDCQRLHTFVVIANNNGVCPEGHNLDVAFFPVRRPESMKAEVINIELGQSSFSETPARLRIASLPVERLNWNRPKPSGNFSAAPTWRLKKKP